ncbi:MAG: nitrogenase component 1 [Desulfovibrio sp.]|nr:nitrogenase component 1 [Desulfovibrio sp.]
MNTAFFMEAKALAALETEKWPSDLVSSRHLIYSSPAALSFHSPGAQGFGVKRAALSLPNSHMLLFSPGCCGRNTSALGGVDSYYGRRMHHLLLDETDIVTGRYLTRVEEAAYAVIRESNPEVLILLSTCVDALLGTDVERLSARIREKSGIPVLSATMYALTREGHIPPMVGVRRAMYSLLEKRKKNSRAMNILGFFTHLHDDCELYALLREIGIRTINELGRMRSMAEFSGMAEANFNLVLNPESRYAASYFLENLGIPSIELSRTFEIEKIHAQYEMLGSVLETRIPDTPYHEEALEAVETAAPLLSDLSFAVGETISAEPFSLALALLRMGARVPEIFAEPHEGVRPLLKAIAALSPTTRIYSNLSPSMRFYTPNPGEIDMAIGRDALFYHKKTPGFSFCSQTEPFGYKGLLSLLGAINKAHGTPRTEKVRTGSFLGTAEGKIEGRATRSPAKIKGLLTHLSPFAPDQSGVVSVLFGLGGTTVICDAGGCTGNICGFDEPRFGEEDSALFSAGLRDMDAILGRDEELLKKTAACIDPQKSAFLALVGTPVPAVIATDFQGLANMAEKRLGLPVLPFETTGTRYYDVGASKAYLAVLERFANEGGAKETSIGILGATPFDLSDREEEALTTKLARSGFTDPLYLGRKGGLEAVRRASEASRNIVLSPSGIMPALYLQERFGTPFECVFPVLPEIDIPKTSKKILIIHQQVFAASLRNALRAAGTEAEIHVASFFLMHKSLLEPHDHRLTDEYGFVQCLQEGGYDIVMGDSDISRALRTEDLASLQWIDIPHTALSGRAYPTGDAHG